ncbi:uncharacterized protein BDR25DRAFT_339187 [Lindgomyces ingoldianus]|uniref:Uncharacterized protein n=1 Tax=Lindgomyces ingoldianus TaxID=673940 RepID=A0ACB6RFV8_9PLEO|nr:uncharacterized protein BDR25DRAFT_339187 [Lindgomyces ingoldianus]KAF2477202.1 hypothetical protein BDR25DRAFT_339187 [Lindgomyces ingoldianus]
MAQCKLNDLVDKMKDHSTLNGWDVLVSYDLSTITTTLNKQVSQAGLLDPLKWTDGSEEPDIFGKISKTEMSLQLSPPTLSVPNNSDKVRLSFPIKDCTWRNENDPSGTLSHFPEVSNLILMTPVVAIQGTYAIGPRGNRFADLSPNSKSTVAANTIQILNHEESNQWWAFSFDFKKVEAEIESVSILKPMHQNICQKIKTLFQNNHTRFYLGSLRQSRVLIDNTSNAHMTLYPSRFCFSISGSALCIWIGVIGSGDDGQEPSAQSPLQFRPDGQKVLNPIPAGCNASIIFSRHLMMKFVENALSSLKICGNLEETDAAGLVVKMKLMNSHVEIPGYNRRIHANRREHYDRCSFDMNSSPALFSIGSAADVSVSYNSEADIYWWYKDVVYSGGDTNNIFDDGKMKATFEIKGTGQWSSSDDTQKYPNQVVLRLSFDQAWCKISNKPYEFSQYPKVPPNPLSNAALVLDYAQITDVLFPVKHCFDSGGFGHGTFATPRDFILTGKLREGQEIIPFSLSTPVQAIQQDHQTTTDSKDPKDVKAFVHYLLSDPMPPMYGDLVNALASDAGDSTTRVAEIFKSYDYPQFTTEDFGGPLHVDLESLLDPQKPPGPGKKVFPNEPVEHRLFGGLYTVSVPLADEGEMIVVHPVTGEILHEGEKSLPVVTLDRESSETHVEWSRSNRKFNVVFKAALDAATNFITLSFNGTVVDSLGATAVFAGKIRVGDYLQYTRRRQMVGATAEKSTDEDGRWRADNDWKTPTGQMLRSDTDFSTDSIINTTICGLNLFSLLAALAAIRYAMKLDKVEKGSQEHMKKGLQMFQSFLRGKADQDTKEALAARSWMVDKITDDLQTKIKANLDGVLQNETYEALITQYDPAQSTSQFDNDADLKGRCDAVKAAANMQIENSLETQLRPLIDTVVDVRREEYEGSHLLADSAGDQEAMNRAWSGFKRGIQLRLTEALKMDLQSGPAVFLEASLQYALLNRRSVRQQGEIQNNGLAIRECQTILDEKAKKTSDLEIKKEKEGLTTDEEIELKVLKTETETKNAEMERLKKRKEDMTYEKANLERRQHEADQKAEKAAKKLFER